MLITFDNYILKEVMFLSHVCLSVSLSLFLLKMSQNIFNRSCSNIIDDSIVTRIRGVDERLSSEGQSSFNSCSRNYFSFCHPAALNGLATELTLLRVNKRLKTVLTVHYCYCMVLSLGHCIERRRLTNATLIDWLIDSVSFLCSCFLCLTAGYR